MAALARSKYLDGSNDRKYAFATYPSVKVYKNSTGSGWNEHLLFGDYITIKDTTLQNGRVQARARRANGWVRQADLQTERVLEVNFVDIGQGDGCHVVTPDDQHLLIDAGEYDNMYRYLVWRFYLYNKKKPLPLQFKIIISHSDKDHYNGFSHVFSSPLLPLSAIYHNGIVERPGESHAFGRVENGYITTLVTDTTGMKNIITDENKRKGPYSTYPKVLFKALKNNEHVPFQMLSKDQKYVENYDDQYTINDKPFTLEVLGPIVEENDGKQALRYFTDVGKSKNGHSVILKLTYGKARILLGGDLNEEAGEFLVAHYRRRRKLKKLQVDVAKACHHGSPHFFYDFIKKVNAAATVISSGDNESYAHPRPDAIGALGKCGYGLQPLIFSTELARSSKEMSRGNLKSLNKLFDDMTQLESAIKDLKKDQKTASEAERPALEEALKKELKKRRDTNKKINSYLTKYGMINVRTDGHRMIIAQKLESKAAYGKWDLHQLEYDESAGRFVQV